MLFLKALVTTLSCLYIVDALPTNDLQVRGTGTCSSGEFVASTVVGVGGTAFCESNVSSWGGNYLPVTALNVWGDGNYITAIQATFSDGSQSPVHGSTTGATSSSISVNYANDAWDTVTLYGFQNGKVVRHLRITTKSGSILNSGYPNPVQNGYNAYPQNVGSGLLYGFTGATDTKLVSLGFLFLGSTVTDIAVSNFNFPNPPTGDEDITPTDLDQAHFYNSQPDASYHWAFNNQKARTVTHTFQQTFVNTFAVAVGTTASLMIGGALPIPVLNIGGSTMFTWTTSEMDQTTVSTMVQHQVQYNADGNIAPGKGVDVTAIAGEGTGTFPYTSTVTFTLKNGNKYSFEENGSLYLDAISDATVVVYEDDKP